MNWLHGPKPLRHRSARRDRRGTVACRRASTVSMPAAPSTRTWSTGSPPSSPASASRETEVLRFPPVMSRRQLEKSGYLKSFPHLLGCVCALHGTETEIRARSSATRPATTGRRRSRRPIWCSSPAACYPVYPLVASRGEVPAPGSSSTSPATASAANRRGPRPAAVLPHARVCVHRHPGADPRVPPALDDPRAGLSPVSWGCPSASISPATRSSAAAAS